MENTCKNCKHWFNKQKALDYVEDYGICEGLFDYGMPLEFKIHLHEDLSININQEFKNDDLTLKNFEYDFCTYESFGCVEWENKCKE